jgi:hypothetical protein
VRIQGTHLDKVENAGFLLSKRAQALKKQIQQYQAI